MRSPSSFAACSIGRRYRSSSLSSTAAGTGASPRTSSNTMATSLTVRRGDFCRGGEGAVRRRRVRSAAPAASAARWCSGLAYERSHRTRGARFGRARPRRRRRSARTPPSQHEGGPVHRRVGARGAGARRRGAGCTRDRTVLAVAVPAASTPLVPWLGAWSSSRVLVANAHHFLSRARARTRGRAQLRHERLNRALQREAPRRQPMPLCRYHWRSLRPPLGVGRGARPGGRRQRRPSEAAERSRTPSGRR